MNEYRYAYREGVHGEYCVDRQVLRWERVDTAFIADTKADALKAIKELNIALKRTDDY